MVVRGKLGVLAVAAGVWTFGAMQGTGFAQATPPPPDSPVAVQNPTETVRLAGIAKDNSRHFGSDPDDPGPIAKDLSPKMTPAAVGAAMRKVGDWQLAQSQQYFGVNDHAQLDGRIWTWSDLRCTRGIWRRRRRWARASIAMRWSRWARPTTTRCRSRRLCRARMT